MVEFIALEQRPSIEPALHHPKRDLMNRSKKKLFLKTYGCQMNVYDSNRMADVLAPHGFELTDALAEADLVILNTCHIREKAAEKVYSELGRLRILKRQRQAEKSEMIIAVAGCVAQAEGTEVLRRAPFVDIVFGPQTYHRLPEMLARHRRENRGTIVDTDFPVEPKFDHLPDPKSVGPTAFLSVQEGCDKFCNFCVVPYTRGAEYSRPASDILAEAHTLVDQGVCEITLIGQNVNAYHGAGVNSHKEWGLAKLIRALGELSGLHRIRYTTSHPKDMDNALIAVHREVAALMPLLHLPVQSGSDRILAAMGRGHNRDTYRRLVDQLREAQPKLALSSDFIVGYPGETDEDFNNTMALIEEIEFAHAFSFKYSARPGTPAATMDNQVPEPVKKARLSAVQSLLTQQQHFFNTTCIGQSMEVLLTNRGRHSGQLVGRTPYLQPVHVEAPDALLGNVIATRIVDSQPNSLGGELVGRKSPASNAKMTAPS